jgi:hypothetical protein
MGSIFGMARVLRRDRQRRTGERNCKVRVVTGALRWRCNLAVLFRWSEIRKRDVASRGAALVVKTRPL